MRFGFFLKEAMRGLRRSSAPALAALLTVLLTALVLGVFIPIVQATTGTANEISGRVVVDVYVSDSATQKETFELRQALEDTANVKAVEFISKGEALERAQEQNPRAFREGAELLGVNPLPASFRVHPEDPDKLGLCSPDRSGYGVQLYLALAGRLGEALGADPLELSCERSPVGDRPVRMGLEVRGRIALRKREHDLAGGGCVADARAPQPRDALHD